MLRGAEKLWEKFGPGHHGPEKPAAAEDGPDEDAVVSGAVRTDFILSAEIMVISLNEVAGEGLLSRAVILAIVAVGITALVYGVVALIVRMDDIGLGLAERESPGAQRIGRALVKGMPKVMVLLATVGVAAMLWRRTHPARRHP